MEAAVIIALIRDILIIVAAGIFILILLVVAFILLRLYPSIRRITRNVEESSNILLNVVSKPLNLVTAFLELVNRVTGLVAQFRSRERRNEDEEPQ
jgi:Mg2+/Co2+ transporter CorB